MRAGGGGCAGRQPEQEGQARTTGTHDTPLWRRRAPCLPPPAGRRMLEQQAAEAKAKERQQRAQAAKSAEQVEEEELHKVGARAVTGRTRPCTALLLAEFATAATHTLLPLSPHTGAGMGRFQRCQPARLGQLQAAPLRVACPGAAPAGMRAGPESRLFAGCNKEMGCSQKGCVKSFSVQAHCGRGSKLSRQMVGKGGAVLTGAALWRTTGRREGCNALWPGQGARRQQKEPAAVTGCCQEGAAREASRSALDTKAGTQAPAPARLLRRHAGSHGARGGPPRASCLAARGGGDQGTLLLVQDALLQGGNALLVLQGHLIQEPGQGAGRGAARAGNACAVTRAGGAAAGLARAGPPSLLPPSLRRPHHCKQAHSTSQRQALGAHSPVSAFRADTSNSSAPLTASCSAAMRSCARGEGGQGHTAVMCALPPANR